MTTKAGQPSPSAAKVGIGRGTSAPGRFFASSRMTRASSGLARQELVEINDVERQQSAALAATIVALRGAAGQQRHLAEELAGAEV